MSAETAACACAIPTAMIEALESGVTDRLPAETYAVGFIRSYCRLLGLESEHYLTALRAAQNPSAPTIPTEADKFGLIGRALRKLPIPRLPRVSSEASMWILIMVAIAAAWGGYSAVFRPQAPAHAAQVHAAEIDLRLPDSLAQDK